MNAPMSEQRLAEILARATAATPGPWEEYPALGANFYAFLGGSYLRGVGTLNFGDGEDAEADRSFTLAARTDVPELVAEVQRLRARVAGLEAQVRTLAVDTLGALPMPTGGGAPVHELTAYEQLFLTFALELAADQIALRPDEFDAADDEALASLRRLTGGAL